MKRLSCTRCVAKVSLYALSAALPPGLTLAAPFDTTADAVVGQPDFVSNDPGQPNFLPAADNLDLSNAADVAVAPDGRCYVSDANNNRILSWPSALGFANGDAADMVIGQPDFVSGGANRGGGLQPSADSFWLPQGLDVDTNGNLWVTDAFNHRVLRFDNPVLDDGAADLVIGQFDFVSNDENLGQGGTGPDVALPDSLQYPGRVRVNGSHVYVADSGNSRVLHYTNPTTNTPEADLVFGQFNDFFKRAKNNDGLGNNGTAVSVDNLLNPIGIALDAFGNLYVCDWGNHRVLRFDDPLNTGTTADAVFGQPDFDSNIPDSGGPGAGLQLPIDVQVDALGSLFLADSLNHRVLVYFDPLFDQLTADVVFGQLGSFTADTANHNLGPLATDADGLHGPTGQALDVAGNLLVLDTNNNRLLRFDTPLPPVAPPDFDHDGDVDLTDHARLADCLTGPVAAVPASVCRVPDLDGNAVLDLADFAVLARCMSGDGVPADVNCAE